MQPVPPVAAALLLATASLQGTILLEDHFDGTSLDFSKWEVPTPFLGRTQVRGIAPEVTGGRCRLRLDTHNPTALVPGDSFWGSEIRTNVIYPVGNGLIVEARTRLVGPTVGGMVASVFTYQFDEAPFAQHDEIDFELLSNDVVAGNERVLTNVFEDDDFSQAGDAAFANVPGLDLTQFNTWRIEWLPDRVKWFVNGALVREDFDPVPDEDQRVHLNFWAPNQFFGVAYDAALQPVASAGQNTTYYYEVDYVRVESVDTTPPPSTLVNGGLEAGDLSGWATAGNVFHQGSPHPRTGSGVMKLYQTFSGGNNTSIAFQSVGVEAGRAYSFNGWGRNGNSGGNDLLQPGNSALLKVVWRNAAGTEIGAVEVPTAERITPATPPQTWRFMEAAGTAPTGAVTADLFAIHLYVVSGGATNGSSWLDDLQFVDTTPAIDFRITAVDLAGSVATVTWNSAPGDSYTLEKSIDGANWFPVQTGVPAALIPATTTSAVDAFSTGGLTLYRVQLLPQGAAQ